MTRAVQTTKKTAPRKTETTGSTKAINYVLMFVFFVIIGAHTQVLIFMLFGRYFVTEWSTLYGRAIGTGAILLPAVSLVAASFYSACKEFNILNVSNRAILPNVIVLLGVIITGSLAYLPSMVTDIPGNSTELKQWIPMEWATYVILSISVIYSLIIEGMIIYLKGVK